MLMSHRIVLTLEAMVADDRALETTLKKCITEADWTPPGWEHAISSLRDFNMYLNQLMVTIPVEPIFDNLFHGLYFIISQRGGELQSNPKFRAFQVWLALFTELYGSFMNTSASANNLYSFIHDETFQMNDFEIPPGGFGSFNSWFSRHIKPGKRPIGTKTHPYDEPCEGKPLGPNPPENEDEIYQRMCDDTVITMPADAVYKGCWPINDKSRVAVSKGNTYSIKELLDGSKYANSFKNGLFTHSYLTVFTYHRYHAPVRGKVLETKVFSGQVYADVYRDDEGNLHAKDGTGYQFKQDRGLLVMDSPVGLVALLPIGMDFISSCNLTVDEGDYINKGDEFGYFLFGGSDMIILFANNNIEIALPKQDKLYKLGQEFAKMA